MKSFSTDIKIPGGPSEIFDHIRNSVSKWWTEDFKGSAAKPGDEFTIHHPGAHYSKQRVTEVIPGKKLVWLVTDSTLDWLEHNQHEWTNTRMIFELIPNGDKTALHFTHEGLVPGMECYERVSEGWGVVIKNRLINFIADQQKGKTRIAKYTVAIEVPKSPEVVFGHIVNDIPKYWPEDFEGKCSKLSDEFTFRSGGDAHYSKHLVTEFAPGKKVVWLVTESLRKPDNFNWTGTKMSFALNPKGNNTLLEFTYDGPVMDGEYDRLVQICDFVIKENLYKLVTAS